MKIKDLINLLEDENQEAEVYVSSDEEGNSYLPLSPKFLVGYTDKESDYHYDIPVYTDEDKKREQIPDDEWEQIITRPVVILFPI